MSVQLTLFHPEGHPEPADPNDLPSYDYSRASPSYFETLDVPIVRGRAFTDADRAGPEVAILSETAAQRFWPGENPIGKRIRRGAEGAWHEVVGVARDTKVRTLGERPRPYIYLPFHDDEGVDFAVIVVATRGDPGPFMPTLLGEIQAVDQAVTPFDSGTIRDQMAIMLYPARMGAVLLSAFGGLALLLAVTGLYGVISYAVSRRTHEVGIRMAIGARRSDITRMVLRDGIGFVVVGTGIGLALAFVLTRLLRGFLYGITVTDPLTFVAIPALLAGVALFAAWVPARRAAKRDPMSALRYE
jgi:putative ABC transport system permease protein